MGKIIIEKELLQELVKNYGILLTGFFEKDEDACDLIHNSALNNNYDELCTDDCIHAQCEDFEKLRDFRDSLLKAEKVLNEPSLPFPVEISKDELFGYVIKNINKFPLATVPPLKIQPEVWNLEPEKPNPKFSNFVNDFIGAVSGATGIEKKDLIAPIYIFKYELNRAVGQRRVFGNIFYNNNIFDVFPGKKIKFFELLSAVSEDNENIKIKTLAKLNGLTRHIIDKTFFNEAEAVKWTREFSELMDEMNNEEYIAREE